MTCRHRLKITRMPVPMLTTHPCGASQMRLKDKIAVVTGAGSGLGKAIAKRLAQEGAKAIVVDVNEAAMASAVREIEASGASARGFVVDVTRQQDVHQFAEDLAADEGRIDIL